MTETPEIYGTTAPGCEPVRDAFAANWQTGNESGAAFALMMDGETVGDLWGGWADRKKSRPWAEDTIVPVFSTGKAVTAMVMAKLVSDGVISYEARVADYWPEFGRAGKERVTVYVCIRSPQPPMAQEGEEMVRGPRFELGTPIFSAGCLKRRRGHKSLRHNVGSSTHSCKSFTALHRVARGNVYRIRFRGEDRVRWQNLRLTFRFGLELFCF